VPLTFDYNQTEEAVEFEPQQEEQVRHNPYTNVVFMHQITEQDNESESDYNRGTSMIRMKRESDLSSH
jgi:hypothetical protein